MKLTVLVDNNTIIDQYYFGEPAVSYWLEVDGKKIIFDVGYSDIFIKNAKMMNIDLKKAHTIVLSHGHFDHTGGIEPFIQFAGKRTKSIRLVAHPLAFNRKNYEGIGDIGTRKRRVEMQKYFKLKISKKPLWLTENLCFLGQIPRKNNYEAKQPLGRVIKNNREYPDYLMDDSALAYKAKKGLVVINGCAHSGISNTIEYAKKVCHMDKIWGVIGGLHLLNTKRKTLQRTIKYLESCRIVNFHPCHCTDLKAKIELGKHFDIQEVGSGLVLEYQ
ncbi:MBL fold metallo-hydrolase [bacterium]|nr:MBL fold metallo-hydrolase [bacterium]